MTLVDYAEYAAKAAQTAIYPYRGNNFIYPILGLIGEIGEVAEIVKKVQRDCGGVFFPEHRASLRKELGDILWYIAAVAGEFRVNMEAPLQNVREPDADIFVSSAFGLALMCAVPISLTEAQDGAVRADLIGNLLVSWEALCHTFGHDPADVAAHNLEKLADRQRRNMLQGSGDNR